MVTQVKVFKIGTGLGEYPEGSKIVDSIFEHFDSVAAVSYNGQEYTAEAGYVLTGNTFEVGNLLSPFANGNIVKFTFPHTITITK